MPEKTPDQEPIAGENQAAATAYLKRALGMNPQFEGDAIIALRSRTLGLKRPTAAASVDTRREQRRNKALRVLETLREKCWTSSPEHLLKSLTKLDLDDLPDLQQAARRLETVARNRAKLPQLANHKHFDGDFFSCLKQVLAASPRETAVLREQVLASFRAGKLRKRGRRMIGLLKKELPELYALEVDWFESLMRQKKASSPDAIHNDSYSSGVIDDGGSIPFWVWWMITIIAVKAILFAVRDS